MSEQAQEQLDRINRLLRQERGPMHPAAGLCIGLVVLLIIIIIIAIVLQSPTGYYLKQRANQTAKKRLYKQPSAPQRVAPVNFLAGRQTFTGRTQESHTAPIVGVTTSSTKSTLPPAPKQSFSGMSQASSLSRVSNMKSSVSSQLKSPQPTFTSGQIKKGVAQAQLVGRQQQVTRHPRGNAFLSPWLHGDVNRQQQQARRVPQKSTQSFWQELDY